MKTLLAVAALLVQTSPLFAQGWIEPAPGIRCACAVHRTRSAVSVRVTGRVARVEVEEWFRNDGGPLGQGDYLYPLPGEAVFSNFSLFQGDRELRGETMDATNARSIYEEIVRRKKDPALIELAGHGLLRARVFPIAPGETRKITLRYTQMLARTGDALQFKYAAGARNGGAPIVLNDVAGQQRRAEPAPLSFTLVIDDASTFGNPFSPTHELQVTRSGRRTTVRPENQLEGDFDVFLPLRGAAVGLSLITHRPSSEPGFFMLTLSPGNVAERSLPRDVTMVLDVSGSMSGEKMEQARAALHALLQSLSAADRFRLIAFSDQVRTYRREWNAGSQAAIAEAEDWIESLRAEGGTNIAGALAEAFAAQSPDSRLSFVIFITDGLPSVGEQNPERIAERIERARGRSRVFAFGVGYDVNTYLLDRLSAAARGSTQYVRPGESVERPIAALATKIRFPVLTDLRIANTPVRIDEIYPVELPDLFANEELVIVGRYSGDGGGRVQITGTRAGRTESFATTSTFEDHELDHDYIPKIWASRKVGFLSRQLKLNGQNPEVLRNLRETALRYGILTEYTSYLVQEPMEQMVGRVAAAPPSAATGQASVAAAEVARLRREARTANAVDMAAKQQADAAPERSAGLKQIGGRAFRDDAGTWVDVSHKRGGSMTVVEPFSSAYFALLRALPELETYWKTMTNVTVAGKSTSIKLAAGGITRLDAARVADIVKKFRT